MGLKLTLRPNERVIVNGCIIRNGNRRHILEIENRADVLRADDLLEPEQAGTPVRRVYLALQTALVQPASRERSAGEINQQLADLAPVFHPRWHDVLFEVATHASVRDYYKAMSALRPLMRHEEALLAKAAGTAEAQPSEGEPAS